MELGGGSRIVSSGSNFQRVPTAMLQANKDALISNLVCLTENLVLDDVMNHLMERRVLTFDERHQIKRNDATDREKVETFVQLLVKKSDKAFYDLIASLRATGQEHVADVLESDGPERPSTAG